eukprot:365295-Chlamydomonas_euryale.AAC.6
MYVQHAINAHDAAAVQAMLELEVGGGFTRVTSLWEGVTSHTQRAMPATTCQHSAGSHSRQPY